MIQPSDVPIPSGLLARCGHSREGRSWLAALPGLLAELLVRWNLVIDLPAGNLPGQGSGSLVLPVQRDDGTAAVLKIALPSDKTRDQHHALVLWNGHGAVRLLESDSGGACMVLERLDTGQSLRSVPIHTALPVWGALVRQLRLVPDDRPQWRELDHIAALAEQWSDDMPAEWERLGRPFPRWLLEAALEVCQTRGAVGRRSAHDVLVHSNLHPGKVLARPDGGGYAAIGPAPLIGEAEFAAAPLLCSRLAELPKDHAEVGLRERCRDLTAAAGLDAEVARQWCIAREVWNALNNAASPHHRGDTFRSLWVAAALAGRNLAGIPPLSSLPEPDEGRMLR